MCAPWLALACACLTAAASAQTLDLGGAPTAPSASDVWRQRAERARDLVHGAGDFAAARARAAAALFDRARALGPNGSAHALVGLILEHLKDAPAGPSRKLLTRALDRLAGSPPDDPGELARRVRSIAALATPPAPSPSEPATLAGDIERWSERLDAQTLGALRRLDAELLAAASEPAFRPSVERTRRVVRAAASVLAIEQGKALRDAFSVAVRRLAPGDGSAASARSRSISQLRTLAHLGEAHDAIGRLDDGEEARRAWRNIATAGPLGEDARRVSDNVLAAAALIETRDAIASERELMQPLRPAYRALVRERRDARERVVELLPRLAGEPTAITDPGVAGVLAALRSLNHAIDGVGALDRLCRDWSRPDAPVSGARLSVRALELSRGLDRGASRVEFDEALARVRRLAGDAGRFGALAERAGLDGAVGDALGDQAPRLRAAMDDAAGGVFAAWLDEASGDALADARERAEACALLADRLGDTLALREPIRTSPPMFLDATALAAGADRALQPAVRAAIGGDTARLRRALEREPSAGVVGRALAALRADDVPTGWASLAHAPLWVEDQDRLRLARYAAELAMAPRPDDALVSHVETLILTVGSR